MNQTLPTLAPAHAFAWAGGAKAALALTGTLVLGACSIPLSRGPVGPDPTASNSATAKLAIPSQWQAPLPHGGSVQQLGEWWSTFGDPLMPELITTAQRESAQLASAQSRIASARAALAGATDRNLPNVSAGASAENSKNGPARASVLTAGLQASWELDVFGRNSALQSSASAQLQGAQATWHEARVLVAAEVGGNLLSYRLCQQQVQVAATDAQSRQGTARLTELSAKAGFTAPALGALAQASAYEAQTRLSAQNLQCGTFVNALVALTGLDKGVLATKLANPQQARLNDAVFSIAVLPGQTISQRPDVYRAERAVVDAAAQVAGAQQAKLPRVTLGGNLGIRSSRSAGVTTNETALALGPLSISLPIFPQRALDANVDAASAAYDAAVVAYKASIRQAVREVEDALAALQSTYERTGSSRLAAEGYNAHFKATQARHNAGLASLLELEEARRLALQADVSQLALAQERIAALVALYRAAGGGWSLAANPQTTSNQTAIAPTAVAQAETAPTKTAQAK